MRLMAGEIQYPVEPILSFFGGEKKSKQTVYSWCNQMSIGVWRRVISNERKQLSVF